VINQNNEGNIGNPASKLATEEPLAEKDQQGMALEHAKKLGEKALAEWKRLKGKIKDKFKK